MTNHHNLYHIKYWCNEKVTAAPPHNDTKWWWNKLFPRPTAITSSLVWLDSIRLTRHWNLIIFSINHLMCEQLISSRLDHDDGQFFRAMEWLMFFSGHHWLQWFFDGFDNVGPSPLNVFWGPNHWNQWFFDGFQNFEGNGQRWFGCPIEPKKCF